MAVRVSLAVSATMPTRLERVPVLGRDGAHADAVWELARHLGLGDAAIDDREDEWLCEPSASERAMATLLGDEVEWRARDSGETRSGW